MRDIILNLPGLKNTGSLSDGMVWRDLVFTVKNKGFSAKEVVDTLLSMQEEEIITLHPVTFRVVLTSKYEEL